ncbi:DNA adenine methylase [Treponema parvum]|uniref:site-specific DNA-methyltransferase (adenine-specific) n=1 Tax=Treponema parvum TaxID=138851 RepID=A0A975ID95_9SPIR|nr:DNA adenine methylase [Treponema parvum]QTQ12597.1 DNA adenine methylase [Treponema parvum]
MNLANDYLTRQIIAYIGNKRKLLGLILKAIQQTGIEIKPGLKFFDAFAGSGVVSRLAKMLNFEIYTNDWEYYSYIIANCYLKTNKKDIVTLFGSEENFQALLDRINTLPAPRENEQYIAKYYAPKEDDIDAADYKTERLFYTHQNALNIDKIRNYIESNFPLNDNSEKKLQIRNILLAELIYEAATHNNTSGVFKACHKGFGGHNKDALTRILGEIKLNGPVLIDSDFPVHVFQEDANKLVEKLEEVDIVYLDPPYNQHQYGSNYHMLNTIAKWDHIPAELELNEKGELREKAAIRHDWINTRSHYCYKEEAALAFENLISKIKAKSILISYSTDGIIPFEEMQRICMSKGKVSIVTNEYTTYRGGKQSNKRQNTNIEFILCINTAKKASKTTEEQLDSIFIRKKAMLLFKQTFNERKLKEVCNSFDKESLLFVINDQQIVIKTNSFFTIEQPDNINELSNQALSLLHSRLELCVCEDKEEELAEIISKLNGDNDKNIKFIKLIPNTLKKLAHKKNKLVFYKWLSTIREIKSKYPELYTHIDGKIEQVAGLAELRFAI